MEHSCGTVVGFFRAKDILEEDTDCKMSYQREEPMQTLHEGWRLPAHLPVLYPVSQLPALCCSLLQEEQGLGRVEL